MEIRKRYEPLKKKYSLPSFDELNKEFEISAVEEGAEFLLRGIRVKMMERIDAYAKIFEEIIQPDTNSFRSMSECRVFRDEDKHQLFSIYKNLMIIFRSSQIVALECDEKKDAGFIKSVNDDWKRIKPEVLPFLEKLEKSWEKESEIDETLGYMG